MFAREFLSFHPACPEQSRRAPLLASRQNFPKSNDSPTYAPLRCKSNHSPTYAKTGGWGVFPAPTFKYHLKCRRADTSSFTEIFSVPARRPRLYPELRTVALSNSTPRLSANLSALRFSAVVRSLSHFELSTLNFELPPFPLNPFLSHHSRTRARNSFRLISLHKTGGYTPAWSDHASLLLANGCRFTAKGSLLTPFPTSLTQEQGRGGLVIPMRKRAGLKASATTGNAERRPEHLWG
jgi:hypothetical protein